MTIKLACAGTGYIAKIHARAAQAVDGVELAAVVNHREKSMAAFASRYGIPRQYLTIEELIAAGNVDAVSINTPNYLHAPQTIAALDAGLHVFVEKPMAMTAAQAEEMVSASQRNDRVLMVGHCWRFDEEVLWLKKRVDAGELGRIVRTKGYGVHQNWGPGGWFTEASLAGGGALADMGVHAFDTARFLMGDPEPVSIYARIGTFYADFDVDDTGVMLITWENGVTSYVESGWWQPHMDGPEASTQLYGTAGFGEVFPTHLEIPDPKAQRVDEIDGGFPFPRENHCPQAMYDRQMAYFVSCVEENRTPVPGGLEGLVNVRILEAAYESAQRGEVVRL